MGGRNYIASETGSLWAFIFGQRAELTPRPLSFSCQRRGGLQGEFCPWDQVRMPSCILGPKENSLCRRVHRQQKQHSSWVGSLSGLHLQPGGRAELQNSSHLPAESTLTTETQERVGLPGVLTEANRITGGTSSSQRQLEHLTPEITRWQKANIRILPTETKNTWHHQKPVIPPQQTLDNPTNHIS